MPFITIKMDKGRSVETKRKVAAAVTDAIVKALGSKPEWITVVFEDYERENWSIGGALQLDRHGPLKPDDYA